MTDKSVRRWNPFDDLLDIQRDIGRFFRKSVGFGTEAASSAFEQMRGWAPAIDMYAKDGDLMVKAELPGVNPGDIDVSVRDNTLTITGERKSEEEMKKENVFRVESSYGKFQRSLSMPKDVNAEDIKATYKNGVLTVEVAGAAKKVEAEEKKVNVEVED